MVTIEEALNFKAHLDAVIARDVADAAWAGIAERLYASLGDLEALDNLAESWGAIEMIAHAQLAIGDACRRLELAIIDAQSFVKALGISDIDVLEARVKARQEAIAAIEARRACVGSAAA